MSIWESLQAILIRWGLRPGARGQGKPKGRPSSAPWSPPFTPPPSFVQRLFARLCRFRFLRPLLESILPPIRLLKDERVQIEIRMAPYRVWAARRLMILALILLLLGLPLAVVALALRAPLLVQLLSWLVVFLALTTISWSFQNMVLYEQWRFIVTDKRIIITAPDPRRAWVADAVYLKGGKIQVVDTSWSPHPVWGFFQAMTGARDVILSLAGYEFKPEGAEVKGGLRFPDILPEDIARLEEIVFG
ncbi:MAG: hypothetical protein N2556_06635 [Anaerolineae bacterium]|nr:hypothetical protein [Anaerolineae bacterium]